ncbi:uncharacterized protein LOC126678922 [Mercurialis annua]|uniref:uncharacterized protein LOC126678922 n=1 Tax=Mercurialis annua TaxID=3986 RepID=UPI0024AEC8C0|nr:uncharacterized protein LOC126678922 [Mercurialis annua]
MSRCYPYLRNGEAVSETIQTDLNKPLTDKLKRKKDKKEKRSKIQHKKSTSLSKLEKRNDDDEPERSGLTEEHGRPICHQSLSSDSTTRSLKKRKSDDLVHSASIATQNNGNVIRRIPSESSSDARSEKKEKSSRHRVSGAEKKLLKAEGLYKRLFGDWSAPPVVYDQNDFDDESWLSGTRTQDVRCDKRIRISRHEEPGHEASSFWPCARNLPEADIYALPYTILF